MTNPASKKARQMPKGGRKGGTRFPRTTLTEALVYAKKLVSKSHIGPQSRDVVLMGVIGSKYDKGELGMSALKQYGLMTGDTKINFSASELAKKIAAAPTEELIPLYRRAALNPTVFKALFDTYHSDTVSKAKLKQRAADLHVHPDETANCVDLYVSAMVTASLVTVAGENITHLASADAIAPAAETTDEQTAGDVDASDQSGNEPDGQGDQIPGDSTEPPGISVVDGNDMSGLKQDRDSSITPRAVFNVNVTLDASLDVEKLERQLALLRRYGAL